MSFFSFVILKNRIKAIFSMMKDKDVSVWKKLLVALGIIYLFSPIDLIPPVFIPFGFIDDLVIWLIIIWNLKDTLDKYWKEDGKGDFSKDFQESDIVEDVSYTMGSEKDSKEDSDDDSKKGSGGDDV